MASAMFSWTRPSLMNGPLLKYQLVSHSFHNETDKVEWQGNETQAVLTSLAPYQRSGIGAVSSFLKTFFAGFFFYESNTEGTNFRFMLIWFYVCIMCVFCIVFQVVQLV